MKDKNQVFLLPFAGGSCFSYEFMTPHLSDVELWPLELPGRGKRGQEAFILDMTEAAEDYTRQILEHRNQQDFILYGHSLGASIGAHIAGMLESQGQMPRQLIFTGDPGPEAPANRRRYLLSREDFIADLKEMGGLPEEFYKHPAVMDIFLPVLRADFEILEGESAPLVKPFQTPIVALMGDAEEDVELLDNWRRFTTGDCYTAVLPGDHFFIHQHVEKVVGFIRACFDLEGRE